MNQATVQHPSARATNYAYCRTCTHRRIRMFGPDRCAASDNDQCQLVNAYNACERWEQRGKR